MKNKTSHNIIWATVVVLLTAALLAGIVFIVNHGSFRSYYANGDGYDGFGAVTNGDRIDLAVYPNYDIVVNVGDVVVTADGNAPSIVSNANALVRIEESTNSCKIIIEPRRRDFLFDFNDGKIDTPKVTVNLPPDMLSKIDLKVNAGRMKVYAPIAFSKLKCTVDAGDMSLYIPENIGGFKCDYEVNAGKLDNNLSMKVNLKEDNDFFEKSGTIKFGTEEMRIDAKVNAGRLTLDEY